MTARTSLGAAVTAELDRLHLVGALSERRVGQHAMAVAVAAALVTPYHLAVRAGTGTGKTVAYLLPLILHGQPAIVTTSTKSLQEQIAARDLPALHSALGRDFRWATVKGRANYLCRLKLQELHVDRGGKALARLAEWANTTGTGDRDELAVAVPDSVWRRVSVRGDECVGRDRCPVGETCFAERAREEAAEVDIVVTNHWVYAASLFASHQMLPRHRVVVVDEAHELDEAIRQTTSTRVEPTRMSRIVGLADAVGPIAQLRGTLAQHVGRHIAAMPQALVDALDASAEVLRQAATRERHAAKAGAPGAQRRAQMLALMAENLILSRSTNGRQAWVEGSVDEPVLRTADDHAGVHQVLVDAAQQTVVFTSATLDHGIGRDGGAAVTELAVSSPYDYGRQAIFYCAADLPDPRDPAWPAAAHAELAALIGAAGGRTLALFTSWAAMRAAAAAVSPHIAAEILIQGDTGRRDLLRQFRDDPRSCLFGTTGLAHGTDIPGDALTLVTLDRLPFPPVNDPAFSARRAAAGSHAFAEVDLRHARTVLAQVGGRLIRGTADSGVFAVLDPRLAHARYRWDLVRAVPPMRRSRDREQVLRFLRGVIPQVPSMSFSVVDGPVNDGDMAGPQSGPAAPATASDSATK